MIHTTKNPIIHTGEYGMVIFDANIKTYKKTREQIVEMYITKCTAEYRITHEYNKLKNNWIVKLLMKLKVIKC